MTPTQLAFYVSAWTVWAGVVFGWVVGVVLHKMTTGAVRELDAYYRGYSDAEARYRPVDAQWSPALAEEPHPTGTQ